MIGPNNFNLITMDAFNDVFSVISCYLNPREHCRTAMVCKQLHAIITQIWLQEKHNTVENRQWIANFYVIQADDLKFNIEQTKLMLKQSILSHIFNCNKMQADQGANPQFAQWIAIEGEENVITKLSLHINSAVDKVYNNQQEKIHSKIKKVTIQGLVNCFSLGQIKKFIEWQQDPFICDIFQKIRKFEQNLEIMKKTHYLMQELALEVKVQYKKLALSNNPEKLVQASLIQEKDKINHQLIDLEISERQEDTPENRRWFAELMVEEMSSISNTIKILKTQSIEGFINSLASDKNIEVSALTGAELARVEHLFEQVFNSKLEFIQSTLKEIEVENMSKKLSVVEMKTIIKINRDPFALSIIKCMSEEIMQYNLKNSQKYAQKLMKEILEELEV